MKQVSNENKLIKWIILLPIAGVLLTSLILTNLFISSKKESNQLEIQNIQNTHISNLKNKIEERIEHIAALINNKYSLQFDESKSTVKEITNVGHGFLMKIYKDNKHLTKKDLYKKIDEAMKEIRFFDKDIGYFFIYDLKDGTSISLPSAPKLVGTSLKKLSDVNGKNLFDSFGKIIEEKNEGFDEWYWNKPNAGAKIKKIGYIRKFEPLNIAFGTAIYVDDIEEKIKNSMKDFIGSLAYKDNSYIFVMNTKGTALLHKNKSIIGVKIENFEKKLQNNVKNIINKATQSKGSFLEYKQSKTLFKNFEQSKKISYVKHIPILNWIIGTGLYTNDLNQQVKIKEKMLKEKLSSDVETIIYISLIVTAIIVLIFIFISNRLKNIFNFYSNQLDEKNQELHKLNQNLEKKVQMQVKENRDKDKLLYQQSKMASMGEMLGNIAHQWRQPLSSISTAASGILIQKEYDQLTEEHMTHSLKSIVKNTQALSQTIDDFRNFYKSDKQSSDFKIRDIIKKVLILIDANLKTKEVDIIKNIEDLQINSVENELLQALLNILNNARDALIEMPQEKQRLIFINVYKDKNQIIIKIKDNAEGINEKILPKVFEPYFTTKHKSQGTGIGLYMTHEIIIDNLKGSIEVENNTFSYKDKQYTGALFTISLPIKED